MKILILMWSLLFSQLAMSFPVGFKGQDQASSQYPSSVLLPGSGVTLTPSGSLLETGNDDILIDGSMEASGVAAWTCTVGTCTKTTNAGEFSPPGKQALKVALSAQAMNVTQSVSTGTGALTQYVIGTKYRVPATMADFQICTLIAGAEKTCVPSANLILDDAYHSIEIPEVITPGSTVGIKFKTTSSYTANAFFDKAYIKQGIGTQALQLDNVYSAQLITTTGGQTNLNKAGWISGCTAANPTVCTLSGFTVAPNCTTTVQSQSAVVADVTAVSATSITIRTLLSTSGADQASIPFSLSCQKSGNDYLASSSAVYSQASANYSRRAYTPTITGFGTPTGISCYESRDGEFNEIECTFTAGTTTATEARVSLPPGLTSSSSLPTLSIAGVNKAGGFAGTGYIDTSMVLIEPSVTYVTFQAPGTSALSKANANAMTGTGAVFSFKARVPIAGWSNSAQIVGSFAGTPKVPGYDGNVDTFDFAYGTSVFGIVCSASPCSYLNQIGTAVSSVTRAAGGSYTINFGKTYSKMSCTGLAYGSSSSFIDPMYCTNCSTMSMITRVTGVGAADTSGNISCKGTY